MSRMPRRGRPPVGCHNDSLNRFKQANKIKGSNGIQALHSPLRKPRSKEKSVVNRCCYVSPAMRDFGQFYTGSSTSASKETGQITQRTDHEQFVTLLQDQYGYDPGIPNITQLKELKKVPCDTQVITGSQRAAQSGGNSPKLEDESEGSLLQKLDNVEEVHKFITSSESSGIEFPSKHIFISKVPRVKVIAEKFSKYKRGNLELRRLDEKLVCVEYDIFNQPANEAAVKPMQRMRAFFSIKPSLDTDSGQKQGLPTLPSNIKKEFEVLDEDLQKLTEKEIEFIDGKIEENKSYLEDLSRILKRKRVINAQKNKTSLDLQSLYEMARKERRPRDGDFSDTNLLSKAELQEVKNLILQRCTSSVHGFSRRKLKRKDNVSSMDPSVISEIILAELIR